CWAFPSLRSTSMLGRYIKKSPRKARLHLELLEERRVMSVSLLGAAAPTAPLAMESHLAVTAVVGPVNATVEIEAPDLTPIVTAVGKAANTTLGITETIVDTVDTVAAPLSGTPLAGSLKSVETLVQDTVSSI